MKPDDIIGLISPEGLSDKDLVIPTDLRGISSNFEEEFDDDFETMLEKLGPKSTAEGILKAREFFEKNTAKESPSERAKPLTVKEWAELAGEDDEEDEDEEDDENGAEEG